MDKSAIKIEKKLSTLDWSIVHYKLKQDNYSKKKIMAMQKEAIRFIALCATTDKPLSPSLLVDEWWHNAILCTKQYGGPVTNICGKFVHHTPNNGTKKAREKGTQAFWNTIDEYEKVFGKPDFKIWEIKEKK